MMIGIHGKFWLSVSSPCFYRDSVQGPGVLLRSDEKEQDGDSHGGLYCRQCHTLVTSVAEQLKVRGKHCHAFANPDGLVFEIGCFGLASGCEHQGRPTSEYSWFPPYAWCFALCRACNTHLGWYYEKIGKPSFFALILNRLDEKSS